MLAALVSLRNELETAASLSAQSKEHMGPLSIFSDSTRTSIKALLSQPLLVDTDKQKMINLAKKLAPVVPTELSATQKKLAAARKDSDEALAAMELWAKRERETNDYASTIAAQEREWLEKEQVENSLALSTMREYLPVNIAELSAAEVLASAKAEGGFFSLELATELKNHKLLHWLVTHSSEIACSNFLAGAIITYDADTSKQNILA